MADVARPGRDVYRPVVSAVRLRLDVLHEGGERMRQALRDVDRHDRLAGAGIGSHGEEMTKGDEAGVVQVLPFPP